MANVPETTEPKAWHRYFAIECNNRAWQLAAQADRSEAESEEMLDAAHAAALHWRVAGTELNVMRAKMLIAEVHALLGFGESALTLANEVQSYFLAGDCPDWERAFVHVIHAHAANAAGEIALHRASYAAAVEAIEAIADEEDRRIVMQTFAQVAVP